MSRSVAIVQTQTVHSATECRDCGFYVRVAGLQMPAEVQEAFLVRKFSSSGNARGIKSGPLEGFGGKCLGETKPLFPVKKQNEREKGVKRE